MILLASDSVILSGLIAAIISGVVSLVGYVITAVIQSKNGNKAVEAQKEIAKMEKDEKLFYESQIRRNDEVRKLFASFIRDSTVLSRVIEEVKKKKTEKVHHVRDAQEAIDEMGKLVQEATERINQLQETVSLIRLYLFDEDNPDVQLILANMLQIIREYGKLEVVSGTELSMFIDLVRHYLYKQMQELKVKTA
ncbi:hypothetical protein [Limosilactobacillus vaginalis]|uniref:hypothetical protein n=1 Tax=Limosilactobacillus vaginalis TaxID=1633 RepID=UPI0025A3333C|nr:hypothetical protein [Limosilactobacillus vaginalis]MDM8222118.1 hypothetical protein [Limosilactobacillus vaginalis]